jgi:uncharacterized protein
VEAGLTLRLVLLAASVVGGVINAVSGGGTLLTFPALLWVGVAPIAANATNTLALTPGVLASALGYRRDFGEIPHAWALSLMAVVGGGIGAAALILSPASTFEHLIPYLLLLATLLFALSGRIRTMAASRPELGFTQHRGVQQTAILSVIVLCVSVYGGYFGAGIGLMLLAAFSVLGFKNVHAMNAVRTLLAGCANGAAVVAFVVNGVIDWRFAPVMLVGAVAGGYAGSSVIRRLDPTWVRRAVVVFGLLVTAWYFVREPSLAASRS